MNAKVLADLRLARDTLEGPPVETRAAASRFGPVKATPTRSLAVTCPPAGTWEMVQAQGDAFDITQNIVFDVRASETLPLGDVIGEFGEAVGELTADHGGSRRVVFEPSGWGALRLVVHLSPRKANNDHQVVRVEVICRS